ncbi:DUF1716-domain-containing protein [Delitschia confertaspora ATCC 74209]|uniref:DUF1716-domain-containing protein n=1 Tax=Delitschia confertaspora ATCC 74209 TaxID=1513339 RepID=A0A9P4JV25_9PLEO|nr:DUF1716-domain-containing protein [Delitschia confertaspora ATCC 74209]
MASIDDIFKRPSVPNKRKFDDPSSLDPTQAYKSARLSSADDAKHAFVTEDAESDEEAGPSLPPDLDDDNAGDEDEEGRFFGGGLDENAKEAMDYLDTLDAEHTYVEEKFDASWLRRIALSFEKKVSKNAELRAKFEDNPEKFMASEADLDSEIKALSILSEHPELYAEFAKVGSAATLVGLLAHENTDIAIGAIEIISELTDEDVEVEQEQWDELVSAMLEADLLSLLGSNFSRFDESIEADQSGVYRSLQVIENLASQPANSDLIGKEPTIFTWLLDRIQKKETSTTQNKLYASEILSILTQSSTSNRDIVTAKNGVETLLTSLSPYRFRDPQKDTEEEEYMENLFNTLTCLVDSNSGKTKFVEAEGAVLCIYMVKDGKLSKPRALNVLDHACSFAEPSPPSAETTQNGTTESRPTPSFTDAPETPAAHVCMQTIDLARGLKPLFTTFMKTPNAPASPATEHVLGIFTAMFRSLPANSVPRLRLLAKFCEREYSKITRLVSLRRDYASRVAAFNERLEAQKKGLSKEEKEELEMRNVSARLEEGLYCLERVDVVLAWLVAEDDGAKKAIVRELGQRDEGLGDVRSTLRGMLDGVLEVERGEREVLETLVGFLGE